MVLFGYFTARFTINSNQKASTYALVKAKVIQYETVFNLKEEKSSDFSLKLCNPNVIVFTRPIMEFISVDGKCFQSNVSLHGNVPLFLSYRNFRI